MDGDMWTQKQYDSARNDLDFSRSIANISNISLRDAIWDF